MPNAGQIVAALAGGALLAITTMLFLRLWIIERRAERQRRIDTAVTAIVAGVDAFRHDWPPDADTPDETAVEVHARAHLRLIATQPAAKPAGRRESLAPYRSARSRPRSRSPRR